MLTADIVPDDAVLIVVVEHGQAELAALGVIRLWVSLTTGVPVPVPVFNLKSNVLKHNNVIFVT